MVSGVLDSLQVVYLSGVYIHEEQVAIVKFSMDFVESRCCFEVKKMAGTVK